MAIAPTGAMYKSLTFDNKTSREFGVYITGKAVYNAPEREVEMITIPGRNGQFALDHGRFENITVSYPASIAADTEADFISAISEFRNFLCSKKGYCRLSDDYNPNEYRMAVYKSGLEVDPTMLRAGEFTITFDCKPQRFLTSGETAVSVASGGTLSNPTLFESSPLLEVAGYGTITFDDKDIEILETYLGEVVCAKAQYVYNAARVITLDTSHLVSGDRIYTKATTSVVSWEFGDADVVTKIDASATTMTNGLSTTVETITANRIYKLSFYPDLSSGFLYGTSSQIVATATFHGTYKESGSTTKNFTVTLDYTVSYNGSNTITISFADPVFSPDWGPTYSDDRGIIAAFYGDSHEIAPLNQVFIDLDIGEAYGVVNNQMISYNNIVALPAELPQLRPGSNEVVYDNTITSLKFTPRWWKV